MNDYMMIIIDLDGRERKAMELAAYSRLIPRQFMTPIIFLSNDRKKEWQAFHEIHCYDFFVKPLSDRDITKIMILSVKQLSKAEKKETIAFSVGADLYPVDIDDILYLERCERTIIVHTTGRELHVPSIKLGEFAEEYGKWFIQVNRGAVMNRRKIKCIDFANAMIEIKDCDDYLTLGRTFLPNVRKAFDEKCLT